MKKNSSVKTSMKSKKIEFSIDNKILAVISFDDIIFPYHIAVSTIREIERRYEIHNKVILESNITTII